MTHTHAKVSLASEMTNLGRVISVVFCIERPLAEWQIGFTFGGHLAKSTTVLRLILKSGKRWDSIQPLIPPLFRQLDDVGLPSV